MLSSLFSFFRQKEKYRPNYDRAADNKKNQLAEREVFFIVKRHIDKIKNPSKDG